MSKKLRCFLKKFTQLTKILHDRRSRRSRQISSLEKGPLIFQLGSNFQHGSLKSLNNQYYYQLGAGVWVGFHHGALQSVMAQQSTDVEHTIHVAYRGPQKTTYNDHGYRSIHLFEFWFVLLLSSSMECSISLPSRVFHFQPSIKHACHHLFW